MNKEKKQMRVLWLSNVPPISLNSSKTIQAGGWLSGAYNSIREDESVKLCMAFLVSGKRETIEGVQDGVEYYGFSLPKIFKVLKIKKIEEFLLRKSLMQIIEKVKPDILHVFGTEYLHTKVAIESFNQPDCTIIHIQGLVSVIAKHCEFGIPFWARHMIVPSFPARGTLRRVKNRFTQSGKDEIAAIKGVTYVMGRTEWDEACTKAINPSVNYIHCGESLRSVFYEESSQWVYEECKKHTIYFSQSSSQVKGLHLVLPVLPQLIKRYPDAHLYIGGNSPVGDKSFKSFIMRSSYGWYLKHLIKKYKLHNYVTFLGPQNAEQVVQNLKNAHVFLSASLIENSSNSIGEAMIVGTPVVSSDVGGAKDFIEHGKNGFIYPMDEPYMIRYYIEKTFKDYLLTKMFSEQGKENAKKKYNNQENGKKIVQAYLNMVTRN